MSSINLLKPACGFISRWQPCPAVRPVAQLSLRQLVPARPRNVSRPLQQRPPTVVTALYGQDPRPPSPSPGSGSPAMRAALSNAISRAHRWQDLSALAYSPSGQYLEAPHLAHMLQQLERIVELQQPSSITDALEVQALLKWIVQRSKQLISAQSRAPMAPPALSAAANALSSLARYRNRALQQQYLEALGTRQQQSPGQPYRPENPELAASRKKMTERLRQQQQEQHHERLELLQQLVRQALLQRHRLSPEVVRQLVMALQAEKELADAAPEAPPATPAAASRPIAQAAPVMFVGTKRPDEMRAAAKRMASLDPALALEWHDAQLRYQIANGLDPAAVDCAGLSGFLSREIQRVSEMAQQDTASSRAQALGSLVTMCNRYSRFLGAAHLGLMLQLLAELCEDEAIAGQQVGRDLARRIFTTALAAAPAANPAAITLLVTASADLGLYSQQLLQVLLARAAAFIQRQQEGRGPQEGVFTGRQLGLLLHSIARLGLRPSNSWLQLALSAAGRALPGCSMVDLERLTTSLLLMRVRPSSSWLAAVEGQVEHLISHQSPQDDLQQEKWYAVVESLVKALALLGSRTAQMWYQDLQQAAAAQEVQAAGRLPVGKQQLQHQQEQVRWEQQQQQLQQPEQRRQKEWQRQQQKAAAEAAQVWPEQSRDASTVPPATSLPHHVRRHAGKHTKHGRGSQEGRMVAAQTAGDGSSGAQQPGKQQLVNAGNQAPGLSSIDDWMTAALEQQQQQQDGVAPSANASQQQPAAPAQSADHEDALALPDLQQLLVPAEVPDPATAASSSSAPSSPAAAGFDDSAQDGPLQETPPAAWAAEQAAKWADAAMYEPPAAQELHEALDDSLDLVGALPELPRAKQQRPAAGAGSAAAANLPLTSSGTAADAGQEIDIAWGERSTAVAASSSSDGGGATGDLPAGVDSSTSSSSSTSSKLADLMAEVDMSSADDAEMVTARAEAAAALGLDDSQGGDGEQLQDLLRAADAVQQASDLLDQQVAASLGRGSTGGSGAAATGQCPGSEGHPSSKGSQGKQAASTPPSTPADSTPGAGPTSSSKEGGSTAAPPGGRKKRVGPPLGFSGLKPFTAAAQTLASGAPNKALLSGVLMSVEQQLGELAAKAAVEEQGLDQQVLLGRKQAAAGSPIEKAMQTLRADMERLRKRAAQDKELARDTATADVVTRLLPLLDSFDAAISAQQVAGPGSPEEQTIHAAYAALHSQLLKVLQDQGVVTISETGVQFDPNIHEAVMRVPAAEGQQDGEVARVFRQGYQVGDKLIRPALVVVATTD